MRFFKIFEIIFKEIGLHSKKNVEIKTHLIYNETGLNSIKKGENYGN